MFLVLSSYAICRKNVDKVPFVFCNRHKEIPNFEQYNSVTDKKIRIVEELVK